MEKKETIKQSNKTSIQIEKIKKRNTNSISDLCKMLKTSRPEQYIYTCIKEIFPTAIKNKKFDWLLFSDFDIFIPELNFAIEYDGFHWHKDKDSNDFDKNKLAKENHITLFRIREAGLKETDCDCYFYDFTKEYTNIDKPINAIIDFINIKYNKNIERLEGFNLKKIKQKTLENLKEQQKKQSLIGNWPEIEKYWDYEHNNEIKPEHVRHTDKVWLKVICPYCNKNVEDFNPLLSFKYYGKYSFTPHICKELDSYCISLLEKKTKNGKIELSMKDLDDRRLKDWLIRVVKNRGIFKTIRVENIFNNLEKKLGIELNFENLYKMKILDYNDFSYDDIKRMIERGTLK